MTLAIALALTIGLAYPAAAQARLSRKTTLPSPAARTAAKTPAHTRSAPLGERLLAKVAAHEKSTRQVVGFSAVTLDGGRTIASHRAGELFMPASNMKVVTTAFALARLGGEFEFKTTVYLAPAATKGGPRNVIVVGDFDPTLGDPVLAAADGVTIYDELDAWAGAVKESLGKSPCGDVFVVSAGKGGSFRPADWGGKFNGTWYGAPVAELNFNNNCIDVAFAGGKGRPVAAVLLPDSRYFDVVNSFKVGRGG